MDHNYKTGWSGSFLLPRRRLNVFTSHKGSMGRQTIVLTLRLSHRVATIVSEHTFNNDNTLLERFRTNIMAQISPLIVSHSGCWVPRGASCIHGFRKCYCFCCQERTLSALLINVSFYSLRLRFQPNQMTPHDSPTFFFFFALLRRYLDQPPDSFPSLQFARSFVILCLSRLFFLHSFSWYITPKCHIVVD